MHTLEKKKKKERKTNIKIMAIHFIIHFDFHMTNWVSAEFKSSARLNSIDEFGFHGVPVCECRQLQEIHASAGSWKAILLIPCTVDAEGWV